MTEGGWSDTGSYRGWRGHERKGASGGLGQWRGLGRGLGVVARPREVACGGGATLGVTEGSYVGA
jgi:hypothetical protein